MKAVVVLVPILCLVGGGLLGVSLVRKARWGWLWGIVLGVVVASGVLWVQARGQDNGWDAIAVFIPVIFLLAPGALGMLLGAALVRLGVVKG